MKIRQAIISMGYKAYLISTIVDFSHPIIDGIGYKAYLISTIVDFVSH